MLHKNLSGFVSMEYLYIAIIAFVIFLIIIKIVNATLKEVVKFAVSIGVLAAVVWVIVKIVF